MTFAFFLIENNFFNTLLFCSNTFHILDFCVCETGQDLCSEKRKNETNYREKRKKEKMEA